MMRTVEVLLIIIIMTSSFLIASLYAVLPQPRQVSPLNLRRLALTTLQTLDIDYDLSKTAFNETDNVAWSKLQIALSACLPPNIVYNLTVYEVLGTETQLYNKKKSISNAESLGVGSDASSYLVASSDVTSQVVREKIGAHGGGGVTLYIMNCSDANSWWTTGYTTQRLAEDLYNLLSPYFQETIMVQNTTQLGQLLNGTNISNSTYENVTNAVVINTLGEAVPIPPGYYASTGVGYDSGQNSYARYCYTLGQRARQYNWTFASIVGYPLYYVCNTGLFPNDQNSWGIYGMKQVGAAGFNAFLRGLDNQAYSYDSNWITGDLSGVVYISPATLSYCNYYGIYPSPYHTATRALPTSIINTYHLTVTTCILGQTGNWLPGAIYRHVQSGGFLALGLARTPDIRLTAIGLLCDYKPRIYRSEYTAAGTSRLIILQLGQVGGV